MLRRFIWSPATRQQSSSAGTGAFSTTVFTFAPKRAVPKKGTVERPTRTEHASKSEREISTPPHLALAREPTQSKAKGRSATRVQEEEQYKHWYRHTYGVGDKRDTTWSAVYPHKTNVAHTSLTNATTQTGNRRRQPSPRATDAHAYAHPYDSLARSMEIQQCSKIPSDILAVVAGEGYASSSTTGFGAEGALDASPVDNPCKRGAKSRRAKAKAKAKARAEARSRDLLSARREHNADHAHWFKHTYCTPDWDVVLVEALLNHSSSSSSIKVHLHASQSSATAVANRRLAPLTNVKEDNDEEKRPVHQPIEALMNSPSSPTRANAKSPHSHLSSSSSHGAHSAESATATISNNNNNINKNCLCDLSRAARSSVEMSMLLQRLQNLVADPQDMTARTIFNLH